MIVEANPARGQIETNAETYDLTMEDCLARAFRNNPDIQRLRAEVERAAGTRLVYRSRALPQLAAQVRGGWRQGSLYDPDGPYSVLTAQFSQPLIDVGIPPTLHRAKREVILAQQSLNGEATERLHETRRTFLRALYCRDLTALCEEMDRRLQANVDNEQRRFDAGTGSQSAVTSARIQELNLERDLADLRNEYFGAVTRLAELCGSDLSKTQDGARRLQLPQPVGALSYRPVTLDLQKETGYALQHRADLRLLRALIEAAADEKRIAQAGYFPSVSLTAAALFIPENELLSKQTDIVPGHDSRSTEVRAGAALSWRVIDNGQVTGAARRTEAVRQGYEIALRKLEQNVPRELAVIAGALQSAAARREALSKSAAAAGENLKLIETRISLGAATQYDFLRAQTDLLSIRSGIVDATFQHEAARAELDRATGRYLEFRETPTP